MADQFSRSRMMFGDDGIKKLNNSRVAVFGVGGVGGSTVEALARIGVGEIDIVDNDTVDITNINRQIFATHKTLGMPKVLAAKERISEINPDCVVNCFEVFFSRETAGGFDFTMYDYVVDAVDNVTAKILLAVICDRTKTPIISSMGTGNKLDPTQFEVADIYKTSVCPLARVMRRELKARGIKSLKTVYSKETPCEIKKSDGEAAPSSSSFVPPTAGLIIAGEVIKDLLDK